VVGCSDWQVLRNSAADGSGYWYLEIHYTANHANYSYWIVNPGPTCPPTGAGQFGPALYSCGQAGSTAVLSAC
jgi:hypothetical protein